MDNQLTFFFSALIQLAQPQFKLVLDSVIWAFKHTMRNVADTGIHIYQFCFWLYTIGN